jgi:hypothetical protein
METPDVPIARSLHLDLAELVTSAVDAAVMAVAVSVSGAAAAVEFELTRVASAAAPLQLKGQTESMCTDLPPAIHR